VEDVEKQVKGKIKEINENPDIDLEDSDQVDEAIRDLTQFFMSLITAGEAHDHLLEGRLKNFIRYNKNARSWEKVDRHILFIQRILDMLTEGGRCVIVLPQGIFNNSQERFVRRFITSQARILAVLGLHGNSFKPHTGTKTSCLFLRKYSKDETPIDKEKNIDYPIFFATSNVSFKDNSGRYLYAKDVEGKVLIDKKGNQIYDTDLYDIADAFKDWGLKQLNNGDKMFDFLND
jgi:type I restriction-modification system DNA methylase subunit